jgi:hypothetical protein
MKRKIMLVEKTSTGYTTSTPLLLTYESDVVPAVGDSILISGDKQFDVTKRVMSTTSNDVVLIGVLS